MALKDRLKSVGRYCLKKNDSGNPYRLVVEISNACNLKCSMCPRLSMTRKVEFMDEDTFRKILDDGAGSLEFVSLNGYGEPLLHPKLSDYISMCKKRSIGVAISTNCTLLDEKASLKLLKNPPDVLILAVDGVTPDSYEKVRVGSNFDRVIHNVKNFLKLAKKHNSKMFIILQCIYMTETKEDIKNFKDFFSGYSFDAVRIRQLTHSGRDREDDDYANNDGSCYWLWNEPMVLSNGTFVPCCQDVNGKLALGNIKDTNLIDLWSRGKIEQLRTMHAKGQRHSIPLCKQCNMYQPHMLLSAGASILNTTTVNKVIPGIESVISKYRYKIETMEKKIMDNKKRFKALLVTSPSKEKNNFWTCSISSPVGSLMPPCDLASIAGVLKASDIEVKILDIRLFSDPLSALDTEIDDWQPDAIVTNLGTASAIEDYQILKTASGRVDKIICFCFHAMAQPAEVFEKGATHILAGDPEYAVTAAIKGTDIDKGLWTAEDYTAEPGWIKDVDSLPYPALDLIDTKAYHSLIMGKKSFSILLATRGCPHSCTYCVIPFFLGNKIRTFSVDRIIGEIERDNREFQISSFFFIDSAMNLNINWLTKFCEEIIKRDLKIEWCCNLRVSPVNHEIISLMKKAGCFRIFLGVEDLDAVEKLKRKTNKAATLNAFKTIREVGIETVAFAILLPGMDKSESAMAKRIVKMIKELGADAIQCNITIPYPGSAMFDEYLDDKKITTDWSCYDPAGNTYPYSSEIDLVAVRRKVYLLYYLSQPSYIFKMLKKTGFKSIHSFVINSVKVLWG